MREVTGVAFRSRRPSSAKPCPAGQGRLVWRGPFRTDRFYLQPSGAGHR